MLTTDIHVQVRPAQQDRLLERLKTLQEENRHTFPGTIARYVLKDREAFTSIHIWLVWKDVEMPDEGAREEDLAAFRATLADVLDWETAEYSTKEGIIYT